MSVEPKQFWSSLVKAKVLDEPACKILESKFDAADNIDDKNSGQTLANWLCQQKAISRFQADILLANGNHGLQYGNYVIVSPIGGPADAEATSIESDTRQFLGRHTLTRQGVKMTFFGGETDRCLAAWNRAKSEANLVNQIRCPLVAKIHEAIAIPEFRFVVSEIPAGKSIAALVPPGARLPKPKVLNIVTQIATAMKSLHKAGAILGEDIQQQCFVQKNGRLTVETDLHSKAQYLPQDDVRRLGILWYRLASGRAPLIDSETKKIPSDEFVRLKKYELDNDSIRLLQSMLFNNPAKRPTAAIVSKHLTSIAKSIPAASYKPTATQLAYEQWLKTVPGIDIGLAGNVLENPVAIDLPTNEKLQYTDDAFDSSNIDQSQTTQAPIKQSKSMLVPLLGSMAAIGLILGAVVATTLHTPNGTVAARTPKTSTANTNETANTTPSKTEPSELNTGQSDNPPGTTDFLIQRLIDDDNETLWQTPTTGPPIDFSNVPVAPKIAFALRPAELLANPRGSVLLRSAGAPINETLNRLQENIGFPLSEIKQLLITFHSNDDFQYETFYRVTLTKNCPPEFLTETWNNPESKTIEESSYLYRDDENCFYLVEPDDLNAGTQFAFASKWLIEETAALAGANAVSGAMKKLAADTDAHRHVSAIFLRAGLFNDEGQKLMGPQLAWLNRRLALGVDQFVRGVAVSLHIDDGNYLEIDFDHTVDLKANQLQTQIRNQLMSMATDVGDYSGGLSSNSYWDNARNRMGAMMNDLVTNLRIGVDDKQVLANGWYHPAAAHNWLAATDLLLTYGESQFVSTETTAIQTVPQTLQQLLQTPRNLSVSTSPDLVILINNLQQEIIDDYGDLPFNFEIRLMGSDLSKEGITQNQRPSDFDLQQKPLSSILTEIMVRANPDKNITGPDDPACKMVWVVADDPDQPDRKIIMITTRTAATEKSYDLPAAFKPK